MFYNIIKAKDIINLKEEDFEKDILLENNDSSLNLIALKKDFKIDTHTSNCNAAVYVIDGEIEICFEVEKFKIEKGEMLMFPKDVEHYVKANKDSKFFVIKI